MLAFWYNKSSIFQEMRMTEIIDGKAFGTKAAVAFSQ